MLDKVSRMFAAAAITLFCVACGTEQQENNLSEEARLEAQTAERIRLQHEADGQARRAARLVLSRAPCFPPEARAAARDVLEALSDG